MNNWKDKTILIAEDDSINFRLMNFMLKKTGATVVWAKNGQEALNMVNAGDIDAILMDVQMPVMDGPEAASKIRLIDKKVPIVILSAYNSSDLDSSSISETTNDFLNKPVKADKLFLTMEKYFGTEN